MDGRCWRWRREFRARTARICGLLAYRQRPEEELTRLLNVARPGQSGETYAFDEDGYFVSESRFLSQLRALGLAPPDGSAVLTVALRDPGVDLTEGEKAALPRETAAADAPRRRGARRPRRFRRRRLSRLSRRPLRRRLDLARQIRHRDRDGSRPRRGLRAGVHDAPRARHAARAGGACDGARVHRVGEGAAPARQPGEERAARAADGGGAVGGQQGAGSVQLLGVARSARAAAAHHRLRRSVEAAARRSTRRRPPPRTSA